MAKDHPDEAQRDDRHDDQRPEERLEHPRQRQEDQRHGNDQHVAEANQELALFFGFAFEGDLHAEVTLQRADSTDFAQAGFDVTDVALVFVELGLHGDPARAVAGLDQGEPGDFGEIYHLIELHRRARRRIEVEPGEEVSGLHGFIDFDRHRYLTVVADQIDGRLTADPGAQLLANTARVKAQRRAAVRDLRDQLRGAIGRVVLGLRDTFDTIEEG